MPTTNMSTAMLLISNNLSLIDDTRTSLTSNGPSNLVVKKGTTDNLFQIIDENQPELILLDFDFDEDPLDLLQKLVGRYSKVAFVPILSEPHLLIADQVLLSGARTFVKYPFQCDNFLLSIRRAMDSMRSNQAAENTFPDQETSQDTSNVFTVFSPKGGVGTTTVAVNLAISLHKQLKEEVLLIDGKHLFGHISLYLNLRTGNSLTDFIPHVGMLEKCLVNQVVVSHVSGIHVLPSPYSIPEAQGIRPDDLYKIIQFLQQQFHTIVIDGGNNLNDNTVTYMDSSQKILLVLNPDLASLRDVRQFMEVTTTLSYPREKILLILNKAGRKADVKKEEIEKILNMKIFGILPADENLALSCLNEGIPMVMKNSHHPISRSFTNLAKDLVKHIQTTKQQGSHEVLKKIKNAK